MKKIWVRVPVRADLAGGTLDLWPLYLFHPGSRTINVAVSFYAECTVESASDVAVDLRLGDTGYEHRYQTVADLSADPKAALIARAVEHFRLTGIRIETKADAPRGSGLGGSSALAVAVVRALSDYAGQAVEGEELITLVRDLETRLINVPAGIQDYYPPVYGGLSALHLHAGRVARHPLTYPIHELAHHFILHYTGVAHFSGTNNWEIYKRQIDGDRKVRDGLTRIAQTAVEMEQALEENDTAAAGAALAREWANRKALFEGVSNPEIEQTISVALAAGAWGGKVCGAGGGGCVVFLAPRERREAVIEALKKAPGETLNAYPVAHGMAVESSDDTQGTLISISKKARHGSSSGSLEQLYVTTKSKGAYKPYYLAEAEVSYDEPRTGTRRSVSRSYAAPVDCQREKIEWSEAKLIDTSRLTLQAVPSGGRKLSVPNDSDALVAATADGEHTFREFLLESERLTLYYNPTFGLYSEPNESKEAFIKRCLDAAAQHVEEESDRLEATFRRRIDQIRERSEREQREAEEDGRDELSPPEVGIAWGQTLYNITSGKAATSTKAPESPAEADYMEKIALLQKTWDRELELRREDINSKARAVEEVTLMPAGRNIEITRTILLWAPRV